MAFEKKTFAPDAIANARRLYEDTQTPLDQVAAALGTTRSTLASRIIEWGWTLRMTAKAGKSALRRKKGIVSGAKTKRVNSKKTRSKRVKEAGTAADHKQRERAAGGADALAARVQRVVERELDAIDQILGAIGAADAAEAERAARTLASLARALKEVMRLAAPDESAEADDDDPVPRDLDEFRRELARRIDALAAGGAARAAGDRG